MSPPPWSDSPIWRSSTSLGSTPERFSASATAYFARSNALTSSNVPLRAVPIGVRAAATMTASGMTTPSGPVVDPQITATARTAAFGVGDRVLLRLASGLRGCGPFLRASGLRTRSSIGLRRNCELSFGHRLEVLPQPGVRCFGTHAERDCLHETPGGRYPQPVEEQVLTDEPVLPQCPDGLVVTEDAVHQQAAVAAIRILLRERCVVRRQVLTARPVDCLPDLRLGV